VPVIGLGLCRQTSPANSPVKGIFDLWLPGLEGLYLSQTSCPCQSLLGALLCESEYESCLCRHRHVPKAIYKAEKFRQTVTNSDRRKEDRRKRHSAPGSIHNIPARKKKIVQELE
jgi:hypothetical protein